MLLEDLLSPKYYETLERNNICTAKQIILLSSSDIKKLTNLAEDDIKVIKNIVSQNLQPQLLTCHKLLSLKPVRRKVSSGCFEIDRILCDGFRTGTLTEIYGESGSGKTQIGLHTTVYNWAQGCVYICTEDLFPVKRYEQMKSNIPNYCSNVDYGKNTFIEHITEPDELLSCVRVRLPKLLSQISISLIVIDSAAAPFRVESANYMQRADELRQLANSLIKIAQVHNLAVLCINQVTASFNNSSHNVIPSLGLAWSNMICTRLYLKKTDVEHFIPENKNLLNEGLHVNVRELSVEFAPHLPFSVAKIVITPSGIIAA